MKRDEVPIKLRSGSRNNYVETSLFEPVHWILKEKENAEMAFITVVIFLLMRLECFNTSTYVLFLWSVQTRVKNPLKFGSSR